MVDKHSEVLNKITLNKINERPRGRNAALGAAVGSALFSYALATVVLILGAAVTSLFYRREAAARTVRLTYDLGGEATSGFAAVRAACEALSGAEKIWRVEGEGEDRGTISNGGGARASGVDSTARRPVEVGLREPPGISANVDIWSVETDLSSLYFLPECVLSYKDDRYRAIAYDALGVVYGLSRTIETGELPKDAEVVGERHRYVKPDGGPDLRRTDNPRCAVALYGLLSVTGTEPGMRLLVSNKAAAVRFARAFGSGQYEERTRGQPHGGTAREERARRRAEAKVERARALLEVLGVEPGASTQEINAAYKKKAKMYHPDRVATLDPEVREMAELRMKEINAAYAELKRKARDRSLE